MSATLGGSVTGVTSEHPACHLLLGAGWPGTQSRGWKVVLVLTVVFSRQCSRWWCWLSIKEVPLVMCCSSSVDP